MVLCGEFTANGVANGAITLSALSKSCFNSCSNRVERGKNEPSFIYEIPIDRFICIIEPGLCFFPQKIVVDGVFLICCEMQKRGGGVPQRARLTAECHYHRTAQRGGEGGSFAGKGEGARASGFTD